MRHVAYHKHFQHHPKIAPFSFHFHHSISIAVVKYETESSVKRNVTYDILSNKNQDASDEILNVNKNNKTTILISDN